MKKSIKALLGGAFALALISGASAGGFLTNGLPPAGGTQYPNTTPLTGNELFPGDTQLPGGANPQSEAISSNQLAAFGIGVLGGSNVLIGGDATTNLFQRATTGASQTTTVAYGGPDRWAYWSGTSTAMTVSRDTTAADLPVSYQAAFKMARTSGQTGVVPVCMAQEVETVNAIIFAGSTAEFDFNAFTGANFSPANANVTAYIVYGTGTDEGISKLAFGLNAGGGGSTAWTGQANATAAVISLGGVSTAGRYGAIANVPATATELAAVICWTPVGTAGTNDYVALDGLQLRRSGALASLANATVGYNATNTQLAAFDRRQQTFETELQQRYTYSVAEGTITAGALMGPVGQAPSATTCAASVPFPVTMRIAPTYTNALTATTFKLNSAAANVALSTPFSVTTGANTVGNASITFTASGLGATPGFGCILVSAAGSGLMLWSSEL